MSKLAAAQVLLTIPYSLTFTAFLIRGNRVLAAITILTATVVYALVHLLLGDVKDGWPQLIIQYLLLLGGGSALVFLLFEIALRRGWVRHRPDFKFWPDPKKEADTDKEET